MTKRRCRYRWRATASNAYQSRSLVLLNNRHYDPTVGVFISVDPLVTMTGEPYIYGAANPVTISDPSGLCGCENFDPEFNTEGWGNPGPSSGGSGSGGGGGGSGSIALAPAGPAEHVGIAADLAEIYGGTEISAWAQHLIDENDFGKKYSYHTFLTGSVRYTIATDGANVLLYADTEIGVMVITTGKATDLERFARAFSTRLKGLDVAVDSIDIASAFLAGFGEDPSASFNLRAKNGVKSALPPTIGLALDAVTFSAGARLCASSGAGVVLSGSCGMASSFGLSFIAKSVSTAEGAPASFCSTGVFDATEADAMGFHHTTESTAGC